MSLKDKLDEVDSEIESLTPTAKQAWAKFDKLRKDLAESDTPVDEGSDAFEAAHEANREYGEIADRIDALKETRMKLWAMSGEREREFASPGQKVAEQKIKDGLHSSGGFKVEASETYKGLREQGAFTSSGRLGQVSFGSLMDRGELHALIVSDPNAGSGASTVAPLIEPDHRGLVDPRFRPLVIMDLITVGTTDSDSIDFVRETGWTNNAEWVPEAQTDAASASVVEGGYKPQSTISYEKADEPVRTLAHWVAVTKKSLADVPRLQSIVDNRLRRGLMDKIEDSIISGDGQDENLTGILNTQGIQHQGRTGSSLVDDVLRAITKVRLANFEPNAVGINPLDFQEIRLERENQNGGGAYLFGPPSQAGETTLWGVRTVQATQFAAGQPIVGDFRVAEFYVREGVQVLASDSHADFFTRNLVAVLAETRGALIVPEPEGLCEISADSNTPSSVDVPS